MAKDPGSFLTEDLCIIEGNDFFVHGVIEIPVHDYEHEFGWGVWVSHKKENFEIYREHFDAADIGPFLGWLATEIDYYPKPTLNLKTMAHYHYRRGVGLRHANCFGAVRTPALSPATRRHFPGGRLEDGSSLRKLTTRRLAPGR